MSIFNLFKKKNVEKLVEEVSVESKPEKLLTIEERINIFKKNNVESIETLEKKKSEQPIFNIGDVVKLDVVGSPEMTVFEFAPFDFWLYDCNLAWWSTKNPTEDNVLIDINSQEATLTLKYFDANYILQTIETTPDKVTKVVKKLDEQEEILNHINQKQVCPECGGELIDQNVCFTSFPPKYQYVCAKCLKTIILTK